jgi:hypothetical protein
MAKKRSNGKGKSKKKTIKKKLKTTTKVSFDVEAMVPFQFEVIENRETKDAALNLAKDIENQMHVQELPTYNGLDAQLKEANAQTNPFALADKDLGLNSKFDDSFIRLEKFNPKPAPYTPWYTKLLNFFKKL